MKTPPFRTVLWGSVGAMMNLRVADISRAAQVTRFVGDQTSGTVKPDPLGSHTQFLKRQQRPVYYPNLAQIPAAPEPPSGVVSVEQVYPQHGDLAVPRDAVFHCRAKSTVPLIRCILELVYGDDMNAGESDLVHDGTAFRGKYNVQESSASSYTDGGFYWREYYIKCEGDWPTGKMYFNAYIYDSSGTQG